MDAPDLVTTLSDRWRRTLSSTTTAGYLAGWRAVRWMPETSARRAFDLVADRVYARDGRSVQRLRGNLSRLVPGVDDLEAMTEAGVHSYLRYWCEAFRLPSWPVEDVVARTVTVHEERVHEAYAAGRGVVAVLPHMANWDWAGVWASAVGMPLMTVAERLEPARLYDEFVAYRARLGMQILPLTGEAGTMTRLVRWVERGGLVCLLADRDLSRTAVTVRLAGAEARMPRGPAELAIRTGAPLLPVTLHYTDAPDGRPGMAVVLHEVVPAPGAADVADPSAVMMQGVADAFSGAMLAHPQDWHMMQRVFTSPGAEPRPAPGAPPGARPGVAR